MRISFRASMIPFCFLAEALGRMYVTIFRTRGSQTEFSYRCKKHGKIVNETYAGSGVGLCNGLPAAATWTFTDAGERAKNDTATLRITGGCNLSVSGNLRQRNHRYQPH